MPHRSRQEEVAVPVRRTLGILAGVASLFAVALVTPAQAQVDVLGRYTIVGTSLHYTFDVVNNTADDVILVSARLPDRTFVITDLMAPSGFTLNYSEADGDGNGVLDGYIDFLADESFAPFTTTTPFTFASDVPLAGFQFEGLTSNGDPVVGSVSVAPEPTALPLLLPGLLSTGLWLRRRRTLSQSRA